MDVRIRTYANIQTVYQSANGICHFHAVDTVFLHSGSSLLSDGFVRS